MTHKIRQGLTPAVNSLVVLRKVLFLSLVAALLTGCAGSLRQSDDSFSVAPSASSVADTENTEDSSGASSVEQQAAKATPTV